MLFASCAPEWLDRGAGYACPVCVRMKQPVAFQEASAKLARSNPVLDSVVGLVGPSPSPSMKREVSVDAPRQPSTEAEASAGGAASEVPRPQGTVEVELNSRVAVGEGVDTEMAQVTQRVKISGREHWYGVVP